MVWIGWGVCDSQFCGGELCVIYIDGRRNFGGARDLLRLSASLVHPVVHSRKDETYQKTDGDTTSNGWRQCRFGDFTVKLSTTSAFRTLEARE